MFKNPLHKNRVKFLLLALVILISIFFRFYKLHDFLIFGMDQENEILIVENIVSGKHFPLIGLSSADTGIYRGPLFLYLSTIPYILFNGNPIGGAIIASFWGVVVSLLIYKIGSKMFSFPVGLMGALIYSGSFLAAYFDRQFWNPTFIPFISLLIGYLCFMIVRKKSYPLTLVMVLLFGLATHAHLTILIFIPLIVWVLWSIRRILSARRLLILVIILVFTQLPLIFFDLRHNFLNSRAILGIVTFQNAQSGIVSTFPERAQLAISTLGRFIWIPPVADFLVESSQCKELTPFVQNQEVIGLILILFICGSLLIWYLEKQKNEKILKALLVLIIITLQLIIFLIFYKRYILPYYFTFYFPWLSLLLAWCVTFLWQKKYIKFFLFPTIAFFLFLNIFTLITSRYSFSYKEKMDALQFVSQEVKNKPYSLEALGECPRFGGLRYLTGYKVGVPISSYMDSYFAWLYPKTIKTDPKAKVVLLSMIDPRMSPDLISKWEELKVQYLLNYNLVTETRFDKIHVLIFSQNKP